jgi:SAM-dependent methyltransferase
VTTGSEEPEPLPIPWTAAYQTRRERTLQAAVHDRDVIARFASRSLLPSGYGRGLDERCVEYPWLISQLPPGPCRLLDAGSTLNNVLMLDVPSIADKALHIVTLAPEAECHWQRGISYFYEDLRSLPMKDGVYDVVASISALEHVGCDNTFYTRSAAHAEERPEDFIAAARELVRVLKPGGLLLVTVPFGVYEHHGAFQQFDRAHLATLEAAVGATASRALAFYRYAAEGWQLSTDAESADARYVSWVAEYMRTARWPDPPLEPDGAAAARAVACLAVRKE